MNRSVVLERFRRRQQVKLRIEELHRVEAARLAERHAALDLGRLNIHQIYGCPLATPCPVRRFPVDLDTANAQAAASGIELHFLIAAERSGNQSSCDHGTEAFHGERTVDGKPEPACRTLFADRLRDAPEFGAKL